MLGLASFFIKKYDKCVLTREKIRTIIIYYIVYFLRCGEYEDRIEKQSDYKEYYCTAR